MGLGCSTLGFDFADLTQGRVQAAGIAEALDVPKQTVPGFRPGGVDPIMDPLDRKRSAATL